VGVTWELAAGGAGGSGNGAGGGDLEYDFADQLVKRMLSLAHGFICHSPILHALCPFTPPSCSSLFCPDLRLCSA
jgi:hypothetical protein